MTISAINAISALDGVSSVASIGSIGSARRPRRMDAMALTTPSRPVAIMNLPHKRKRQALYGGPECLCDRLDSEDPHVHRLWIRAGEHNLLVLWQEDAMTEPYACAYHNELDPSQSLSCCLPAPAPPGGDDTKIYCAQWSERHKGAQFRESVGWPVVEGWYRLCAEALAHILAGINSDSRVHRPQDRVFIAAKEHLVSALGLVDLDIPIPGDKFKADLLVIMNDGSWKHISVKLADPDIDTQMYFTPVELGMAREPERYGVYLVEARNGVCGRIWDLSGWVSSMVVGGGALSAHVREGRGASVLLQELMLAGKTVCTSTSENSVISDKALYT